MSEDLKIVAIGPRSEMLGLQSIGVELISVDNQEEMAESLRVQANREEVRLILLSETMADELQEEVEELRGRKSTVIMLVPSHLGAKNTTMEWMRETMERTIGVDVLSE
jgi:vacuolar-type H+-ATPase subunit F/Vma7